MVFHVTSFPIVEKYTIYMPIKIENVIDKNIENIISLSNLKYIFSSKSKQSTEFYITSIEEELNPLTTR
jgi:hypothetical protein